MLLSLPGFRIGVIIALCHISGICQDEIDKLKMLVRYLMAPWASFLMWRVFIQSGQMSMVDLANRIASFVSTGVKDGVPVNGSWYRLSCLYDVYPIRRIGGDVGWFSNLLFIILVSRYVLSAIRTPLLGELCGSLPPWHLAIRHRCDVPVRWSHLLTADFQSDRLSSTTSFLDLFFSDRWALLRRDLVRVIGLVHPRSIWLKAAGLVEGVECGRPEWWGHWSYSLLSWRSSRLVLQFLFRQFLQGICRRP